MKNKFTYADSEAGLQTVEFSTLSEIISYIENFPSKEPSHGEVLKNGEPILEYKNDVTNLDWFPANV